MPPDEPPADRPLDGPPAPPRRPEVPDLIGGRYRVGRAVGRGGMGTVWLCRDEMLRRDVAVKQVGRLPGESVTDSARALREARSSAGLSHRNVVTVFDVVEEAGAIWLVMEHVPSRSLADIIAQDGPLDPTRVADIGAQVADGLAAAHAAGTMHRDVKPGNILVREDGVAKISDFGIARSAGDPALTQSGFLTGTPSYFSPELARGAPPTPAADVWALGATLYAAVEGRAPYKPQANPIAVLHDIARQQPPPPRRAEFLEPVLLRMMDRDPDSRWSMDDAAHGLHRLVDEHVAPDTRTLGLGTAVGTRPPAPTAPRGTPAGPPPPAPGHHPPRRNLGRWATLLLVVLLLAAGGIAYALTRDGAGSEDAGAGTGVTGSPRTPSETPSGSSSGTPSPTRSGTPSKTSSPSPSTTPTPSPSTTPTPSPSTTPVGGSSAAAFLRGYFAAAPGGTDEGWAQLGPGEQAQGRASYNRFWRGIASVGVSDVRRVGGTGSVVATLTYRTTSGRVSVERKRLDLIRSADGGYLIDGEAPAG